MSRNRAGARHRRRRRCLRPRLAEGALPDDGADDRADGSDVRPGDLVTGRIGAYPNPRRARTTPAAVGRRTRRSRPPRADPPATGAAADIAAGEHHHGGRFPPASITAEPSPRQPHRRQRRRPQTDLAAAAQTRRHHSRDPTAVRRCCSPDAVGGRVGGTRGRAPPHPAPRRCLRHGGLERRPTLSPPLRQRRRLHTPGGVRRPDRASLMLVDPPTGRQRAPADRLGGEQAATGRGRRCTASSGQPSPMLASGQGGGVGGITARSSVTPSRSATRRRARRDHPQRLRRSIRPRHRHRRAPPDPRRRDGVDLVIAGDGKPCRLHYLVVRGGCWGLDVFRLSTRATAPVATTTAPGSATPPSASPSTHRQVSTPPATRSGHDRCGHDRRPSARGHRPIDRRPSTDDHATAR